MNLVAAGAISNAITASLSPLIPEDFNEGHLVYYFYANIGFAVVMLIGYWSLFAFGPTPQPAVEGPANNHTSFASQLSQISKGSKKSSIVGSFLATADRGASAFATEDDKTAALLG